MDPVIVPTATAWKKLIFRLIIIDEGGWQQWRGDWCFLWPAMVSRGQLAGMSLSWPVMTRVAGGANVTPPSSCHRLDTRWWSLPCSPSVSPSSPQARSHQTATHNNDFTTTEVIAFSFLQNSKCHSCSFFAGTWAGANHHLNRKHSREWPVTY